MLYSEMIEIAKGRRMVGLLIHSKRCFGSHSTIGIVASVSPIKVDECGTIAELVTLGHTLSGLEWMDPFLTGIPSVSKLPQKDFKIIPDKPFDGGPISPWVVAEREQETARVRATDRRKLIITQNRIRRCQMQELDFLATAVLRRMQYTTLTLDECYYWGTAENADYSSVMTLLKTGMVKHAGSCYSITEEGRAYIRERDK